MAVHDEQLAEHGGASGVRDIGLLEAVLARPPELVSRFKRVAAPLAAAYGFGIALKRPFVAGNERTAFVVAELFLALNGYALHVDDVACVLATQGVAAGELDEAAFAAWIDAHVTPIPAHRASRFRSVARGPATLRTVREAQ